MAYDESAESTESTESAESAESAGLALFECVTALSSEMAFITSVEANRTVWVNQALVDATGYTLEDYQFERFEHPFIPPEDTAHVGAFLGEFLAADDQLSGVVRNRFIDRWGATLHVRSRAAKVTWQGRPALLFITTLDEEKETASLEAMQRYRTLVEAATDSIVRLRPDLTVQYSNACFQQLVGRAPVELSPMEFPDLVASEHRAAVRARLRREETPMAFDAPLIRRDGSLVFVEGTFIRIARGPDAGLWQSILRDTTEKRRLDARVQRAEKEETLGRLAGGIAHDLNNILTAIMGSASFVEQKVQADAAVAEALADIRVAAQRAGELSTSMLAYAGEGNVERVPIDLRDVVRDMKPLLGSGLGKNVELRIVAPDEPAVVLADETQLQQVIMNLVTNAADATRSRGGAVTLEAGTRAFDGSMASEAHLFGTPPKPGPVAFACVRDRGTGMSNEVLRHMFDPFYSTKAKGRGLGLAAVLGIVGRHDGCVHVLTEEEAGTEVTVLLPLSDATAVDRKSAQPKIPLDAEGTILVVDDETALRRMARRALELAGYDVVEAESGESGLAALNERSDIAAVLLDQTMPGMGGDRALAEIRLTFPRLPVIRTSGYAADGSVASDAYTRFLGKPYGVADLIQIINEVLATSRSSR